MGLINYYCFLLLFLDFFALELIKGFFGCLKKNSICFLLRIRRDFWSLKRYLRNYNFLTSLCSYPNICSALTILQISKKSSSNFRRIMNFCKVQSSKQEILNGVEKNPKQNSILNTKKNFQFEYLINF